MIYSATNERMYLHIFYTHAIFLVLRGQWINSFGLLRSMLTKAKGGAIGVTSGPTHCHGCFGMGIAYPVLAQIP